MLLFSLCVVFQTLGFSEYIKLYISIRKHHSLHSQINKQESSLLPRAANMQAVSIPGTRIIRYYHRAHIHSNKVNNICATEAEGILKLQTQIFL